MEQAMQALDEVFFGGKVTPYVEFQFHDLKSRAKATTRHMGDGRVRIRVDLDIATNVMDLIGSLLHELCHGYLLLYGCRQGFYCKQCLGDPNPKGHDDCWLAISKMVHETAMSLLDGKPINMGRVRSFLHEREANNKIPSHASIQKNFTSAAEHRAALVGLVAAVDKKFGSPRSKYGNTSMKLQHKPIEATDSRLNHCKASDLKEARKPLVRVVQEVTDPEHARVLQRG
jgi:hypothetical protein